MADLCDVWLPVSDHQESEELHDQVLGRAVAAVSSEGHSKVLQVFLLQQVQQEMDYTVAEYVAQKNVHRSIDTHDS